jgi:hypothetical protein
VLAGKLHERHANPSIVLRWRWELPGGEGRAVHEQSMHDGRQGLRFELLRNGLRYRLVLRWYQLRTEESQWHLRKWDRVRHGVLCRWRLLQYALHGAVQGVQSLGQQWHLHAAEQRRPRC